MPPLAQGRIEPGEPVPAQHSVPFHGGSAVQAYVVSALLLAFVLAVGVVAIVTIRARWLAPGDDRGDWEKTLVNCRNLRDEGVLSEEEYRKIRTLVEPRLGIGRPGQSGRGPSRSRPGPDTKRT
jgi:hypothetical protein